MAEINPLETVAPFLLLIRAKNIAGKIFRI